MDNVAPIAIPRRALQKLEFLSGEYRGVQTLFPPGGKKVTYPVACNVSREACERFVKIELFAEVPDFGIESFSSFLTYSVRKECYEMWLFSSSTEEPLHMTGSFAGNRLVMISDPWVMPWGLQKLRGTFTPHGDGDFDYKSEIWEPDGFTTFRTTALRRRALSF